MAESFTEVESRAVAEPRVATHTAFGLRLAVEPGGGSTPALNPAPNPAPTRAPTLPSRLGHRLATGAAGPADLVLATAAAPPAGWGSAEPVAAWDSPDRSGGRPLMRLEHRAAAAGRHPSWWRLSFQGAGDFYVSRRRVVQVTSPGDSPELADLRLLGPVLAFWLELYGLPTLHASAVVVPGAASAVAFLARHGGGKSNLVAAFLEHGGGLLSDDLLAVQRAQPTDGGGGFRALPAYPQLRLWPADAERVTGGGAGYPRVLPEVDKLRVAVGDGGFGRFHPRPAPLAALLVPRRLAPGEGSGVRLEPVPPAAALHLLVEHSYLRRLVTGAGLQPDRLTTLARLVETVPMHHLVYPAGFHRLGEVVSRVGAWVAARGVGGARSVGEAMSAGQAVSIDQALEVPLQGVAHGRRGVGAGGEGQLP